MSVEKRKRGGRVRWLVRWREEGRERARTFDRKTDAEDFEREQRRRAQLGAHAPATPSPMRLDDWLREWWTRDAPTWAASTRFTRGHLIDRWIAPHLGGARLRDLGPARVREWRGAMGQQGASANTQNAALSVLSAALGAAVRDQRLPANPCAQVRRLPHLPGRPRALSPLEVERIRAELPTVRDIVLWGLLAYAGLRPEEALAPRWGSVGSVLVIDEAHTYGSPGRPRPIAADRWSSSRRSSGTSGCSGLKVADLGALVCGSSTGGHLNLNNWRRRIFGPAATAAGVTAAPADGRHTYASLLIHEGVRPSSSRPRSGTHQRT